jgi:hypothetical protein
MLNWWINDEVFYLYREVLICIGNLIKNLAPLLKKV